MLIELRLRYKNRAFSSFDLLFSSLSAFFFLSALFIAILSKRKPGDSLDHPIVFVMGLLMVVILFALALIFFG